MAFSISGTTGETLRATMELAGLLTQGNDTAQSGPAPEYSSRIPIVCQGAVVTITKGGAAAITTPIEAFNMDFQLATVTPPDMAATHGFAPAGDYRPRPDHHAVAGVRPDVRLPHGYAGKRAILH